MDLTFISSNIRFDNRGDGQNAWPFRRELLSSMLLEHSPALIATQEGRFDQLKDLESLLKDFTIVDQHRSWIKERMYPSFFINDGVFEVLRSGDLWLSETPEVAGSLSFESAFPRLMTWVLLQPKNLQVNLLVVNTHLDHIKPETREKQIQVLAQEVNRLKQNAKIIIMGDFNDGPSSLVRKSLIDEFPGLTDAWSLFNKAEETSHHAFSGECQNGLRIDWVLVDSTLRVENCFLDKRNQSGKFPSDHFPVVCKIRFS